MEQKNSLYNWEFNGEKQRSTLWYTLAISVVIGLVIWWFLTSQYGMSFVILLIAGIFYYLENNSAETIYVHVTSLGISINNNFYDYGNIPSYTLIYSWENAVYLRLNLLKKWIGYIDLHIDNEIAENIRNILPNYTTENPKKDLTMSDKLIAWLKL